MVTARASKKKNAELSASLDDILAASGLDKTTDEVETSDEIVAKRAKVDSVSSTTPTQSVAPIKVPIESPGADNSEQTGKTAKDDNVSPINVKRGTSTAFMDYAQLTKANGVFRAESVIEIAPDSIQFNASINQRRQSWLNDGNPSFMKLVDAIQETGQQIPICVRPLDDGSYELVYGSRRRMACLKLGIDVKAGVVEMTDAEAQLLAVAENATSEDLSPIEDADAVVRLMEHSRDATQGSVAKTFGKTKQWVSLQISFSEMDSRIADVLIAPWELKEGNTRALRTLMRVDVEAERIGRVLNDLIKNQTKISFAELKRRTLPHVVKTPLGDNKKTEIVNKQGETIGELGPVLARRGGKKRTITIYDNFNKQSIVDIVKRLNNGLGVEN